ncbi:MAG: hypothetical protein JW820_03895 [Spirochaetales bacterium]|nr:hypothetical protein [Spirochaetales bacterium]
MEQRVVADELAKQILQAMIASRKGELDCIRELDPFQRDEALLVISNAITIYLHQHHINL